MKNCPLCRIVRGEATVARLYEDDLLLAFLHHAPVNPGHALLIPKTHCFSVTAVPADTLGAMLRVAPRLAQALTRAVGGDGFNLHLANGDCAGQALPHTHLHIIPRLVTDGFAWGWRCLDRDPAREAEIAATVRRRLEVPEA